MNGPATFKGHNAYRFAAIGVATVVLLVVAAYAFGASGLRQGGYQMSGVFAGTGGLAAGDTVEVAGVRVGEVRSVDPQFQSGDVVVTWKVHDGVKLGPQTRADISASNLLGGQYLKLSGPVTKPYLQSLAAGERRIPLNRTSIPYTLNQAIDSTTSLATRLDTAAFNKLLTEAAGINLPTRDQLATMLTDLDDLTTTLNQRAPEVEAIISGSKNLTATLADKDTQLSSLLTYGQSLLKVLAQRRDDLAAALGNGADVISTLDGVIASHQRDLDTVLADLHSVMGALNTNKDLTNLNITMAWIGPTFDELSFDEGDGRWQEASMVGLGPLQPTMFGPEPNFEPPNYPYPGVPVQGVGQ